MERMMNLTALFLSFILFTFACSEGTKKTNDNSALGDNDDLLGDSDDLAVNDADFAATCGNGFVDGGEPCDGNTEFCIAIDPVLYNGGKAKCLADCSGWDTATCDEVPHECGNNVKEGPEACDGDTKNCVDIDANKYSGGKAKCLTDCSAYDTATCDEKLPVCGNNEVETGEICDGGTMSCVSLGAYIGGTAACKNDCSAWDTATCITEEMCGNDVLNTGETCDKGTNSATKIKNCVEIDPYAYSGGKAKCNTTCDGWDTATCEELPIDNDIVPTDDAVTDNDNEVPDTDSSCIDACSPQGSERCFNETVQTCAMGWEGCLIWSNTTYCYLNTPAQICEFSNGDAYCAYDCTSECTSGDRRCNPTYIDQVDDCVQGEDGCYYWAYMEDCAYWGMICVDPGVAGCDYESTEVIDTIGSSANYYTYGDRLKGNYFSCTSSRTLTEIETYMSFNGYLDITYAIYSSSSQDGTYSLLSQKTVSSNSGSGTGNWYSSGTVSVSLTSGYYYFIGVFFGTTDDISYPDPTYYAAASLNASPLAFGSHLGGGESSSYASLPSTISSIDVTYGYYMRLTTE
ncbi:MAG TPA: hypothetical protein PKH10_04080 [bacterium]|nr:hypothetical protein [bacterium]